MKVLIITVFAIIVLAIAYAIGFEINEHWVLPFAEIEATSRQIHRMMLFNIALTLGLKGIGYGIGKIVGK